MGVPFNLIVSPETKTISGSVLNAVDETKGAILVFDPKTGAFSAFQRR